LSLTTVYGNNIMINPPMAEAAALKHWYLEHKQEVAHLVEQKVYRDPKFLLPPPNESEILSVQSTLKNLHILKTAWVRGKADSHMDKHLTGSLLAKIAKKSACSSWMHSHMHSLQRRRTCRAS
ncbi:Unknown protein, partial [Striga hermonthica]